MGENKAHLREFSRPISHIVAVSSMEKGIVVEVVIA